MKLADAKTIADATVLRLQPYCERIEVAGSIRRQKADPGDIELVAIPKTLPIYDMFGQQSGERSLLNDRKLMDSLGLVNKLGQRYVQVDLFAHVDAILDLFIVLPPATWPVLFTIRTGPSDFSKWIVTSRSKGGCLPDGWRCEDGRIWDGQVQMYFESEEDFLDWLGIHWIEPKDREPHWNYFRRPRA
jgi:DNA polymerase/3'-5' exonuclease PolX